MEKRMRVCIWINDTNTYLINEPALLTILACSHKYFSIYIGFFLYVYCLYPARLIDMLVYVIEDPRWIF